MNVVIAVSEKAMLESVLLNKFIITQNYRFKYLLPLPLVVVPYGIIKRRNAKGDVEGKMLAIISDVGKKLKEEEIAEN